MAEIHIPNFWEAIEKRFSIDPNGIKEIKEILSILNYKTIQSIKKFSKPSEIKLIELEFIGRQKEFGEKYPHLMNFTFGSGTTAILQDIAIKIKNNFADATQDINFDRIYEKVLTDGKKVSIFGASIMIIIWGT